MFVYVIIKKKWGYFLYDFECPNSRDDEIWRLVVGNIAIYFLESNEDSL